MRGAAIGARRCRAVAASAWREPALVDSAQIDAAQVDSHGRFVWYGLMTTDIAAARTFYAKVMGWSTQDASPPGGAYFLFFAGKSLVSGLMELPADARAMGVPPNWIGYVAVDDVDAAAARLVALGGTVHIPPTDAPGISRFAIVSDPQRARFVLLKWHQPALHALPALGTPGRVGWHELLAADGAQAFPFYGDLFGWRKADANVGPVGTYQLFAAGGQTIGGMFTKPATVRVPFWLYYFTVSDIDAAAERVKANGGQLLEGPADMSGGSWIAQCMDPQGAMFGLEGKRSATAMGYFARVAPRK
jgi:predicted enzyme related to lactoylglutathione lyase